MFFTLLILAIISLVIFSPMIIENSFESSATSFLNEVGITEKFELPDAAGFINFEHEVYFSSIESESICVEIQNPSTDISDYQIELHEYLSSRFSVVSITRKNGEIVSCVWRCNNEGDVFYVTLETIDFIEGEVWIIEIEKNPND